MNNLWIEQYRPNTLDGYVFTDDHQKAMIERWISDKMIPHILLSGRAGIGKTTLAKILIKELEIQDLDIMEVNGSKEGRKIEWVDKLINFCQTLPFGDFKVVFIDEADYMNPTSVQPALRNLMEEYSSSVRFILTCNYPGKIIPPIHSRCQSIHIEKTDVTEFTTRVAKILLAENVEFDLDILDTYVKSTYPDLRKCINNAQMNSLQGKLCPPGESDSGGKDYKFEMVELFKQGKIREARKLLCSQSRPDEINDIITWCYNNLDLWAKTPDGQDEAILIIRNAAANVPLIADHEINLAAMITELSLIKEK